MAGLPADKALRRAVVKLQALPVHDFEAVVDSLDDRQRGRILDLLDQLNGAQPDAPLASGTTADAVLKLPDDLSSWLVARVNGREDCGEESADPFTIAPHAQAALRRCATKMVPQPLSKPSSPSLLDRVLSRLRR